MIDLVYFFACIPALLGLGYICYRFDQSNQKCRKIQKQFRKQFEND
jgi:hypothetical protein